MGVTTVRMQADVEKKLEELSHKTQRSKSWLVNQALSEYLERQQIEEERWKQTLEAMDSAAQGNVVPSERVHAWLRSWGLPDEQQAPTPGSQDA